MKKVIIASIMMFLSFAPVAHSVDSSIQQDSCPTCCTTCEPCKPQCLISGWFRTGAIPVGGLTPVVIEQSSNTLFIAIADQTLAGAYNVSFLQPFCKATVSVADASTNEPLILMSSQNTLRLGGLIAQSQVVFFFTMPLR